MNQSRKFREEKGRQSEKGKEAARYKPQLRKCSQSNEEYVACKGNGKNLLKKSQIEREFYLVQRPYILDVVERAYENKKRGGFVHLKRRGMGVFFSRVALILAHCARSRALSNCQKKKKKKKRNANKQTNNQQQKQRKRKTSVDKLHE